MLGYSRLGCCRSSSAGGVVGRVADDDGDGLFVLLLDADPVLLGDAAEVEGALAGDGAAAGALPVHVVQGVDEAEVGELQVAAGALLVGVLDVEVGDVVGEDGHLVGVDLVAVLVLQAVGRQVVDEAGDEGAGAGGRVEDLHVVIGQRAPEVLCSRWSAPRMMKSTTSLGV